MNTYDKLTALEIAIDAVKAAPADKQTELVISALQEIFAEYNSTLIAEVMAAKRDWVAA